MERFWFVLVIIIAYFLGNISPSILLGRAKGVDIKKEGSGNAGTTNALRGAREKSGCHHPDYRYQQRVCCCSDRLLAFGLAGGYVLCPGSIYRSYLASAL